MSKEIEQIILGLIDRANEYEPLLGRRGVSASQDIWNVIVALRGPDTGPDSHALKLLTTARIRRIVGILEYNPVSCFSTDPLNVEQIATRNLLLSKAPSHFAMHFQVAIRVLKRLGYDVPDKELTFHTTIHAEI